MAEEDEDDDEDETDKARVDTTKSCSSVSETLDEELSEIDNNPMDIDLDSRPPPSATSTSDDEVSSSAIVTQI